MSYARSAALPLRLAAVLVWLSISSAHAQIASITEDPQPRNVSVNTKATFTCTGIGDSIWWNSNGVQLDDNEPNVDVKFKLVNELGSMSTLKILVSSPDNPTNITCVVFSSSSNTFDVSNPALLLVQGLLRPVSNIIVTSVNSTYINISWTPPYTLVGVDILGYTVIISNTTTSTENFSENSFFLYQSVSIPDNVTVVPINEGGAGHPATYIKNCPSIDTVAVHTSSASDTTVVQSSTDSNDPLTTEQKNSVSSTIVAAPSNSNNPTNSIYTEIWIGLVCGVVIAIGMAVVIVAGVFCWKYCSKNKSKKYQVIQLLTIERGGDLCDGPMEGPVRPGNTEGSSAPVRPGSTEGSSEPVRPGSTESSSVPVRPDSTEGSSVPVRPDSTEGSSVPVRPDSTESSSVPVRPDSTEGSSVPVRPDSTEGSSVPVRPGSTEGSSVPVRPGSTEGLSVPVRPDSTEGSSVPVRPGSTEGSSEPVRPGSTEEMEEQISVEEGGNTTENLAENNPDENLENIVIPLQPDQSSPIHDSSTNADDYVHKEALVKDLSSAVTESKALLPGASDKVVRFDLGHRKSRKLPFRKSHSMGSYLAIKAETDDFETQANQETPTSSTASQIVSSHRSVAKDMSRRRNDREIEIDKVYSKSAPANVFHGLFTPKLAEHKLAEHNTPRVVESSSKKAQMGWPTTPSF